MLTEQQQRWLDRLSSTDKVTILPYSPYAKEVFQQQQTELHTILGTSAVVLHKGATAWGISGKGDVDIYIPVPVTQFDTVFEQLCSRLGQPASFYSQTRVHWNRLVAGLAVEIHLANQDAAFYRGNVAFWDYIETHPDALADYQRIKAQADGTSTREYYTRKVLFFNQIMQSISSPG